MTDTALKILRILNLLVFSVSCRSLNGNGCFCERLVAVTPKMPPEGAFTLSWQKVVRQVVVAAPLLLGSTEAFSESPPPADLTPLQTLLQEGKASISGRYRFEHVDQDDLAKNAKASTLRTRLGFLTGKLYDFQGNIEFEDVSNIGDDAYNSTVNDRTDYPIVADPDGAELNQAYLTYSGVPETAFRVGREALVLDNERFVGDVGWRQNNQTYDGANIINESLPDLRLFYGFVHNVNRVVGESSPVGDFKTRLNILNARYSGLPFVSISGYSYLFELSDSPALSTATFGLRGSGQYDLEDNAAILYDAEYADQRDYENNLSDISIPYWRVSGGVTALGFTLRGGVEILGSEQGEVGFSTPFATLHAWNGWADKFLTTPVDGLEDRFVSLRYELKEVCPHLELFAFDVQYHDFSAEHGGANYGDEWDFQGSAAFSKSFSVGLKYARYNAEDFSTDTEKLILTLATQFSQ